MWNVHRIDDSIHSTTSTCCDVMTSGCVTVRRCKRYFNDLCLNGSGCVNADMQLYVYLLSYPCTDM